MESKWYGSTEIGVESSDLLILADKMHEKLAVKRIHLGGVEVESL
jgi:hypothetical protein